MRVFWALTAGLLIAAPACATSEIVVASFTQPDGGVTVNSYAGIVAITVSGIGQSYKDRYNDAFYLFGQSPSYNPKAYHLSYSSSTLVVSDPQQQNAVNYILGGLPKYSSDNIYSFYLDTGLSTPGKLHFGVDDSYFADNSGAYTISIASVPEPLTWTSLTVGFGLFGLALRRQRFSPIALRGGATRM